MSALSPEDEKKFQDAFGFIQSASTPDVLASADAPPGVLSAPPAPAAPAQQPAPPDADPSPLPPPPYRPPQSDEMAKAFEPFAPGVRRSRAPGTITPAELDAASAAGNRGAGLAGISRGADQAIAALGGIKPDSAYWEGQEKDAAAGPMKGLQARSALEQSNVKLDRAAQASDPASEMNRGGADFWMRTFGLDKDAKGGARPPEEVSSDREAFARILAEHPDDRLEAVKMLEHFKQARGEKKAAADKSAEDEKTKQEEVDLIKRAYGAKYGSELTPEVEEKLRAGTKEGVKSVLADLQKREVTEQTARKATSGERQASVAEQGLSVQKGQLTTPGFHPSDAGHFMTSAQAGDLGEQKAARNSIEKKVSEAQAILRASGGVSLNSSSTEMTSLKAKFAELYPLLVKSGGFGNLTVGHQHLIEEALSSPSDWRNFMNAGRLPAMLDEIANASKSAVAISAESKGQAEDAPKSASAPPRPGMVRIRDPKSGRTGWAAKGKIPPGAEEVRE